MKKVVFLFAAALIFRHAQAQEIGAMVGISQYQGELAKYNFTPEATNLALGLYLRNDLTHHLSYRLQADYTRLEGDDNFAYNNRTKSDRRAARNLSFYSNVVGVNATLEANLFSNRSFSNRNKWNPYVFAGLGLFHFNPKTELQGRTYVLRDLPTELNKPKYDLTQLNIPLGIGIKRQFESGWVLGFIFQFHYTFTDYLDDVSGKWADFNEVQEKYGTDIALLTDRSREKNPDATQKLNVGKEREYTSFFFFKKKGTTYRGTSVTNDTYYYLGITIGKSLGGAPTGADGLFRRKFGKHSRCPKF